MFSKIDRTKAAIFGSAVLALTVSANVQAAFNLVPNGDFETAGADSWGVETSGGSVFDFPTTGGNAGGYVAMDNASASWGGVVISTDDLLGSTLDSFGVVAGGTYDFQFDMKILSGAGAAGGIKLESWNEEGFLSTTGDHFFADTADGGWGTYSQTYKVDPGATRLKVVLLGIDAAGHSSVYGFDNVGIVGGTTPVPVSAAAPVPAAAWLFGSALAGLVAVRRRK